MYFLAIVWSVFFISIFTCLDLSIVGRCSQMGILSIICLLWFGDPLLIAWKTISVSLFSGFICSYFLTISLPGQRALTVGLLFCLESHALLWPCGSCSIIYIHVLGNERNPWTLYLNKYIIFLHVEFEYRHVIMIETTCSTKYLDW